MGLKRISAELTGWGPHCLHAGPLVQQFEENPAELGGELTRQQQRPGQLHVHDSTRPSVSIANYLLAKPPGIEGSYCNSVVPPSSDPQNPFWIAGSYDEGHQSSETSAPLPHACLCRDKKSGVPCHQCLHGPRDAPEMQGDNSKQKLSACFTCVLFTF